MTSSFTDTPCNSGGMELQPSRRYDFGEPGAGDLLLVTTAREGESIRAGETFRGEKDVGEHRFPEKQEEGREWTRESSLAWTVPPSLW